MKRTITFFLIFYTLIASCQIQDAWVYLVDKPNADFYLQNPLEMLSQRALDRRTNQNIALDITDVPVYEQYINQINSINTIEVLAQSKWMNALHIRGNYETIQGLTSLNFVASIEYADKSLNPATRLAQVQPLTSTKKTTQSQSDFDYGNSANQIEMLNGHLLHQENFTGSGMMIAVLDNGFIGVNNAQPLQRLHTESLILGGYNFVGRNENFYTGGNHGTRVLSTLAGYVEGELVGTAPDAFYYLFITEDNTSETPLEESLWVEAAELADSLGVDVINTSLGYNNFDNPNYNYTYQDMDGITTFISRGANMAHSKGMICVTSAGNAGSGSWQYITSPADAQGSFTIGAVHGDGNYASFSSIGPTSDNRIKPDVMAQGVWTVTSDENGNIGVVNGTSFSSPITAGLVACLWQALPELSNYEIEQLIRESAHLYNNPTAQMGYGIPDFYAAYQQSLSVEDIQEISFLYPNPTSNELYFYSNTTQDYSIKLYDLGGKIVLNQTSTTQNPLEIGHLESGIYFYKIQADQEVKTGKIIKK